MRKIIPIVIVVVVAVIVAAVALLITRTVEKPEEKARGGQGPATETPPTTTTPAETPVARALKVTGEALLINDSGQYYVEFRLRFRGDAYVLNVTFEPKNYGENLTLITDGFQVSGEYDGTYRYPVSRGLYEYMDGKRIIYVYVAYVIDDKVHYVKTEIFASKPS